MLYVLLGENFVSALLSNFLYACAFAFYNYVTFLGYEELSIVKNTTVRDDNADGWFFFFCFFPVEWEVGTPLFEEFPRLSPLCAPRPQPLSVTLFTQVLLIPTGVLAAVLLVLSLFGVNATRAVLSFYFGTAGEAAASLAAGSL